MSFTDICAAFASKDPSRFDGAAGKLVEIVKSRPLAIRECSDLAQALVASGQQVDIPADLRPLADVPSTGGPASLTTLLCPLLIAFSGVRVAKVSASGSLGGAIDTCGVIPGFRQELDSQAFLDTLRAVGFAHTLQTDQFCPADRVLINYRRRLGMMRNQSLATASLIAKKLVVPGTHAVLDCRVGPTGNIADDFEGARRFEDFFLAVAELCNAPASVRLTDNRQFPCSALGRLESLSLLCEVLQSHEHLTPLDKGHVADCAELAADALAISTSNREKPAVQAQLLESIRGGDIWRFFLMHLVAQGGSEAGLHSILDEHARQFRIRLSVSIAGYWQPPCLTTAKQWLKEYFDNHSTPPKPRQPMYIGMRLLASPGQPVQAGDETVEIRSPFEIVGESINPAFAGSVTSNPVPIGPRLMPAR